MKLFNLFRKGNTPPQKTLHIAGIGKMHLVKEYGELLFKGTITSSSISNNFVLRFPVNADDLTNFQIDYYRLIEQNWAEIVNQLPQNKMKGLFIVSDILIPDSHDSRYDIGAEIVMKNDLSVYSVILKDTTVEEVIYIE